MPGEYPAYISQTSSLYKVFRSVILTLKVAVPAGSWINQPHKSMKERKHNYVVGYVGEKQCAYGKERKDGISFVDLLTLDQANSRIKKLASPEADRAIYKLVPVKVIKGKP